MNDQSTGSWVLEAARNIAGAILDPEVLAAACEFVIGLTVGALKMVLAFIFY